MHDLTNTQKLERAKRLLKTEGRADKQTRLKDEIKVRKALDKKLDKKNEDK